MEITKQYEEDGYSVTEYDNGVIVKELIGENTTSEIMHDISEEDLKYLELTEKIEYLTTLVEMQIEGE